MPAAKEIKHLDKRWQELVEKQNNRVSALDVQILQKKVDGLTEKVKERLASFYPEERLLDLGRTMEKIGKNYKMVLVTIAPDHESLSLFTSEQAISELPVNMKYSGHFFDFTRFLDDMPGFHIAFKLKRMELSKDMNLAGQLVIELQGVLVIRNKQSLINEKIKS
jgi:Tfp pilus assembly protein PilO